MQLFGEDFALCIVRFIFYYIDNEKIYYLPMQ